MKTAEQLAEEYVKAHVIYANDNDTFLHHLELYRNNPEYFSEAETCDGCEKDSIAVYQSY